MIAGERLTAASQKWKGQPLGALMEKTMTHEEQIKELARFIMEEIAGEPRRSEGAVDCAKRIIRDLKEENKRLTNLIEYYKRKAKA